MPKSDTWPGGVGLETMTSMESAGSCDSVVSANSGFSDDSLEYLSAEEKACLMFLEETIESLDTEEDSGLSNDEPDRLSNPGNLVTRLDDLSASLSKSKFNGSQTHDSKDTMKQSLDTKPMQTYLVPTPFVLASGSSCSAPKAKPGVPPDKKIFSKPHFTPSSNKSGYQHKQEPVGPPAPFEVNVVIPPPTKPRDYLGRTTEGPLPRGPLSYDALVYLQKSASTKKTPLCPKVDHTIDLNTRPPVIMENPTHGNLSRTDRSYQDASKSKTVPPVVAPKPKRIPASISEKIQNEAPVTSDSSYNVNNATDPKVVRLEALQKLGLLRDEPPENEPVAPPPPPPKPHPTADPAPNRFARATPNIYPSRSPSFCYSQVPPQPKTRPLQSSASFHHHSKCDQQTQTVFVSNPDPTNKSKATCLRPSATLDNHMNGRCSPEARHIPARDTVKEATAAQPAPHKPSASVGYTVMMVPGMGADRMEALRKLGLLKH